MCVGSGMVRGTCHAVSVVSQRICREWQPCSSMNNKYINIQYIHVSIYVVTGCSSCSLLYYVFSLFLLCVRRLSFLIQSQISKRRCKMHDRSWYASYLIQLFMPLCSKSKDQFIKKNRSPRIVSEIGIIREVIKPALLIVKIELYDGFFDTFYENIYNRIDLASVSSYGAR